MNLLRLHEILGETTVELRKAAEVVENEPKNGVRVMEIYAMPHESEATPDLEKVDVEFLVIGVKREAAERHRAELIEILNAYPQPDRLKEGPSYIEVGAQIGSQGAAFRLFALGKVLGLWKVFTPALLGVTGEQARRMAGSGFVMMSGYSGAA